MKIVSSFLLLFGFFATGLISCNMATPQNYFDQAVLNSNMVVGFGQEWSFRELESPSATMNDKGETVPQKRTAAMADKIGFVENAFEKIKALKETAETKEMLQASKAMYEYILPVYKNEYTQLAKLYDDGAPKEKIEAQSDMIKEKYGAKFTRLYNKMIAEGKLYAAKNNIKVNWADETK